MQALRDTGGEGEVAARPPEVSPTPAEPRREKSPCSRSRTAAIRSADAIRAAQGKPAGDQPVQPQPTTPSRRCLLPDKPPLRRTAPLPWQAALDQVGEPPPFEAGRVPAA